jgi:hypothetical protein
VAELPQNELGAQVRELAEPKPSKYWGAHIRNREGVSAVATGVDINSASNARPAVAPHAPAPPQGRAA